MKVQPVPAVGEEFDPRVHEALETVEREDIPDQHVFEEVRRGYKMRDGCCGRHWCGLPQCETGE